MPGEGSPGSQTLLAPKAAIPAVLPLRLVPAGSRGGHHIPAGFVDHSQLLRFNSDAARPRAPGAELEGPRSGEAETEIAQGRARTSRPDLRTARGYSTQSDPVSIAGPGGR